MSLGNLGIVRLVKFCFILEKKCKLPNAAENVDKAGDFWLNFSDRVWKIEAPLSKNNSSFLFLFLARRLSEQ